MALAKMKLVNVIGGLSFLDDTVTALGKTGVFQPDETAEFFSDNESLIPISSVNDYQPLLDKLKELMAGAGIRPQIVDSSEYDDVSTDKVKSFVSDTDSQLGELISVRDKLNEEIAVCDTNIEKAQHFVGLDLGVKKIADCEYIITRFGRLPKDSYVKLQAYSENPYVEFFPCTKDDAYYWGTYVTPISEADSILKRSISRIYTALPTIMSNSRRS